MKLADPILSDRLVRLEPLTQDHFDVLADARAEEAIWQWMSDVPKGAGLKASLEHFESRRVRGEMVAFIAFLQSGDQFAGVVAFDGIDRTHRRVQIPLFWYPQTARGLGVFPATQGLMIQRALDWGARRIGWMLPSENTAAIDAIARLGAREEGRLRHFARMADGSWSDMTILSMLHDEAELALRRIKEYRAQLAHTDRATA